MITYDISVLFGVEDPKSAVTIKCHDTGVNLRIFPKVEKRLSAWRSTTAPYTIPAGCTAVLKVAKPDETYALTDGKIEGNRSIYFEPCEQSFTAQGTASAEVNIYNAAGRRITTATFYLDVSKECASNCAEDSESCVDILGETIKTIKDAAAAAEGALKAAVNPPKISDHNTWLVWDEKAKEYTDTGVKATFDDADKKEITKEILASLPNASGVSF